MKLIGPVRQLHRAVQRLSLSTRLLAAVTGVALVALVASDIATYWALHSSLYAQADQSLTSVQAPLVQVLDTGRPISESTVASLAPGMFVEVLNPQGEPIAQIPSVVQGGEQFSPSLSSSDLQLPATSTSVPGGSSGPAFPFGQSLMGAAPPNAQGPSRFLTAPSSQPGGPIFRVRTSSLVNGYELVLATPLSSTSTTLHRLYLTELAVTVAALAAATVLGTLMVRIGLRPLSKVEETAEAIASGGDLSRRVPDAHPSTEVGKLGHAFNTMVGRIEEAFSARDATEAELRRSEERMRRFVADASHELRTPLTAVSAYAELFERGARDHPDDLERLLAGIRSESGRMGLLVEDLMLLARLDNGRPLERGPVELIPLCAAAADAAMTVGPAWPVALQAGEPVEVLGDASRLRQVIDNLLANVRAHTPPGTLSTIAVRVEGSMAVIDVADNGPGLSPAEAEHVFERFYRADTSRTRESNGTRSGAGTGLGLSIVAAIAKAHGGSVSVFTPPEGGVVFTICLPRAEQL